MRVEVLGGVERRRRWSRDDKMRIIEETLAPGAVVTEPRGGTALQRVWCSHWPGDCRVGGTAPCAVQVAATESVQSIQAPAAIPGRKRRGVIEIELGDGKRVSVDENVDADALGRVLDVLSDDPGSEWRQGLDRDRVHRYAPGHARPGSDGSGKALSAIPMPAISISSVGVEAILPRFLADGLGLSLYAKRLDRGKFIWLSASSGAVSISAAQMAYMLEGIDWRNLQLTWRPQSEGSAT